MANLEQVAALKQGMEAWQEWERTHPLEDVDLEGADLQGISFPGLRLLWANLRGANLSGANLREGGLLNSDLSGALLQDADLAHCNLESTNFQHCNLSGCDLRWSNLKYAQMQEADLTEADLRGSNLWEANLTRANLEKAHLVLTQLNQAMLREAKLHRAMLFRSRLDQTCLEGANLTEADLANVNLTRATLCKTLLNNVDLSGAQGLESAWYLGRSFVDVHTLHRSQGRLPLCFLRGVGLPDSLLAYVQEPEIASRPTPACYLIYELGDQAFVEQICADLQARGIRCWAVSTDWPPHYRPLRADVPSPQMWVHNQAYPPAWRVGELVRESEKVLLVASRAALATWVTSGKAFPQIWRQEERRQRQCLLPLCVEEQIWEQCARIWSEMYEFVPTPVKQENGEPAVPPTLDFSSQRLALDFAHWRDSDRYQAALRVLLKMIIG